MNHHKRKGQTGWESSKELRRYRTKQSIKRETEREIKQIGQTVYCLKRMYREFKLTTPVPCSWCKGRTKPFNCKGCKNTGLKLPTYLVECYLIEEKKVLDIKLSGAVMVDLVDYDEIWVNPDELYTTRKDAELAASKLEILTYEETENLSEEEITSMGSGING